MPTRFASLLFTHRIHKMKISAEIQLVVRFASHLQGSAQTFIPFMLLMLFFMADDHDYHSTNVLKCAKENPMYRPCLGLSIAVGPRSDSRVPPSSPLC